MRVMHRYEHESVYARVHYFPAQTWFQQYDWHGVIENLGILLSQETPGKKN